MRAYFFGNFMLSSIQQGIQAAHAATEMSVRYLDKLDDQDDYATELFRDWAHVHKTMVLCNGGEQLRLEAFEEFLKRMYLPHMGGYDKALPWATFREDHSLGGCIGSIGIVVPYYVVKLSEELRNSTLKLTVTGHNEDIFIYYDENNVLQEVELTGFEMDLAGKLCFIRHAI